MVSLPMNNTAFLILGSFPLSNKWYPTQAFKQLNVSQVAIFNGFNELKHKGLIVELKSNGSQRIKMYELTPRGVVTKETYLSLLRLIS